VYVVYKAFWIPELELEAYDEFFSSQTKRSPVLK